MSAKVRKRNGKWWIFIHHGGVRKAKCIGTRQAAEEVRRKLEAKIALGEVGFLEPAKKEPLFSEYATRWLQQYAAVELKESTHHSYSQLLRLYVLPRFGQLRLSAIQRADVKVFLAEKAAGGDLSKNTLRLMLSTLRTVLNHAVEDGLIESNPAARLGRFTKTEKPESEATALTREESQLLLESARQICPDYFPLFMTAIRAGLRRGELVGLRWADIQFGKDQDDPNRFILVSRNRVRGRNTTPKSKKSRRVDLSKELRRVLLDLRDRRLLDAFMQGRTSITDDLVFPSVIGDN